MKDSRFIRYTQSLTLKKSGLSLLSLSTLLLVACEQTPPDYRAEVTQPLYTEGDADNGALIYEDACGQCHQLTPGLNKKGPQLMNVYGAPAAALADYEYSDALIASNWVWDAETLDPYIADAEKALPGSKMLSDPMPDASERRDVIAYLSTLRAATPTSENANQDIAVPKQEFEQMSNEAVAVEAGDTNKPAANFQ